MKNPDAGNYFGITAEVGLTTFFGDIDEGPAEGNLMNNLAYKIMVNRDIKSIVELSGKISFGNMSGEKIRTSGGKTTHLYFKNSFVEYSLDLGINVLAMITKKFNGKFGLYGTVGMGLIDLKVKLYDGSNDSLLQAYGYDGQKSTTELVIPFGGKAIYHISPSIAASLQSSFSWVDTDKLDAKTGNDNTDYYNFTSIGITYKFNSTGGKRKKSMRRSPTRSRTRYR